MARIRIRIIQKKIFIPDNYDGVITYLEPDILGCEVKWPLGSITMNKDSGDDEIPVELFQILKDYSVKVLHSICQQTRKPQQWPKDWKRSVFIPIPKKGNAKECTNTTKLHSSHTLCFPDGSEFCLQCRRPGFNPWVGKIPWRRKWQPNPVFLPGESHGQRSLVGYSPRGCKELDTTERLHFHFISHTIKVMLKILQARLQLYVNGECPDVQAGFRKGRGTRDQIANIHWIIEKANEFQKSIYFCFIDYTKAFDCVDHNKLENSERDGNTRPPGLLRNLYAGQKATVITRHGKTDWSQIRKVVCQGCILLPCLFNLYAEYIMQHASWMKHKLESRLLGEISVSSDMQMTPPLWYKAKKN